MSTDLRPPAPPVNNPFGDERQLAMIAYIVLIVSFSCWPLAIAAVVLAYVNRDTAPDWLKSHYTFQIHTFWIGFLYLSISLILCLVLIGFPMLLATWIWVIIRAALGINRLNNAEPYPNPRSWLM